MISRREFLGLGGLSLGMLALGNWNVDFAPPPPSEVRRSFIKVRVANRSIFIYDQPDLLSKQIGIKKRDEILSPAEELISPYGPKYNPRWYRLENGYMHSAHLQRVENAHLNPPLASVLASGQLGEVTVPYTQAMRKTSANGWVAVYRLYYGSVHWITALEEGPDGSPWYGLTDELLHVQYCARAEHIRPVLADELTPISPEVPPNEKRIEVNLVKQELTAFEGQSVVLQTKISSGIPSRGIPENGIPTATPVGNFHIQVKMPSKHMGDGHLTDDLEAYELVGVPWVSFFHVDGIAMHGTYWHDNFGMMMSHGCVNMRNEEAKWLYRWSHPVAAAQEWDHRGYGTRVWVRKA